MKHWTVDRPTTLDFDGVAALRVRVVSGTVAVLSTDDQPRLDVLEGAGVSLHPGDVHAPLVSEGVSADIGAVGVRGEVAHLVDVVGGLGEAA